MMIAKNILGIAAASAMMAGSAHAALQWSGANVADADTIALFHFDEGSGVTANNAVVMPGVAHDDLTVQNAAMWATNPGWMTSPSGGYLNNVASVTRNGVGAITGYTLYDTGKMAVSQQSLPVNWGTSKGVTISFWMRDEIAVQGENQLVYLGHGGWRNQQVTVGYRPGFSNAGRLKTDGVSSPDDYPTSANENQLGAWYNPLAPTLHDGNWHHIGLVWDAATDLASLYIDNQLIQLGVDKGTNAPLYNWTTTGGYTGIVNELWYVGVGFGGQIDELLIEGKVVTDFSHPLNVPEPASLALLGLGSLLMFKRRPA